MRQSSAEVNETADLSGIIMGATVLGSLTANYVTAESHMNIKVGATKLALQADVLDKLLKGMIPLGITLLTLYLLKNKKIEIYLCNADSCYHWRGIRAGRYLRLRQEE